MQTNKDIAIQEIHDEFEKLSNLVLSQLDNIIKVFNVEDDSISDDVIENNSDLEHLKNEVNNLHKFYLNLL